MAVTHRAQAQNLLHLRQTLRLSHTHTHTPDVSCHFQFKRQSKTVHLITKWEKVYFKNEQIRIDEFEVQLCSGPTFPAINFFLIK